MDIRLKRVYEDADSADGTRVLIDRLWPRGISKERARLDHWMKDVAPSPELRKEWHGDPAGHTEAGFAAFSAAYRHELQQDPASAALDELVAVARSAGRLTLVYGAKDERVNHAVVLRDALRERAGEQDD